MAKVLCHNQPARFYEQLRPTHICNDVDEVTVEKWKIRPIVGQTYTLPYDVAKVIM